MPSLDVDGWELESAEARHAAAPATFGIPSAEERSTIPPGRMVKLLFLFASQEDGRTMVDCERMWVTVLSSAEGRYTGRLESLPRTSSALAPGDAVSFGPEHIAAVLVPRTSWWRRLLGR